MEATISRIVRVRMETSPLPNPLDPGPKPEFHEDLAALGREAEEHLQYHELKREVNSLHKAWEHRRWQMNYYWEGICKKIQAENHLAEVLAGLEIDIIDNNSVSRYRDELLQELTRPKHTGRFAWLHSMFESRPELRWRKVAIQECRHIPPFALNKAVQIKKFLPTAKFYIEQLVEVSYWSEWNCLTCRDEVRESHTRRGLSFLVVDYNGNLYQSEKRGWDEEFSHQTFEHVERYIDVWE